jgi:hypothetical protein
MIILIAFKYVALETLCSSYVLPGAAYALVSADSDLPRSRSSPRQLCAYWPEFSSPASPRLRCCLTFPSLCLALQRRLLVARRNRSPVVLPRGCGGRAGSELAVDGAGGGGGGGLGVTRQRVILLVRLPSRRRHLCLGARLSACLAWPCRRATGADGMCRRLVRYC